MSNEHIFIDIKYKNIKDQRTNRNDLIIAILSQASTNDLGLTTHDFICRYAMQEIYANRLIWLGHDITKL